MPEEFLVILQIVKKYLTTHNIAIYKHDIRRTFALNWYRCVERWYGRIR